MTFDLEKFKFAYEKWVQESLSDFQKGNLKEIVKKYPFIISDDIPWTSFQGPAEEKTFALVTSGGFFLQKSQNPFETKSIHGDPSFREIPKTVQAKDLAIAHTHYDHSFVDQDPNVIFPFQRLLDLEKDNSIGGVAETHYSFSYVNNVVELISNSIPRLISRIRAEKVDALILVPA